MSGYPIVVYTSQSNKIVSTYACDNRYLVLMVFWNGSITELIDDSTSLNKSGKRYCATNFVFAKMKTKLLSVYNVCNDNALIEVNTIVSSLNL